MLISFFEAFMINVWELKMLKPTGVMVFVFKQEFEKHKCLLLRRCCKYLRGNWQMISGGINKMETASQAALRELFEETGLHPTQFYSGNIVEIYYDAERDIILTNPVFVVFVDEFQQVRLSPSEHDAFQWASPEDTVKILEFQQQQDCFLKICDKFIKNKPMDFLRIDIPCKKEYCNQNKIRLNL